MRYHALASDYDGTLVEAGSVSDETVKSIERLRQSGRKLILVTGRELNELMSVFSRLDLFDKVVAENGALIYTPKTREEKILCAPPSRDFVDALQRQDIYPISVGRAIVATRHPNETKVLEIIRDLGLEMQVIFNKGAVMVLPSGINKATGLNTALYDLGLSLHNTIGIGDAENDHTFLSVCECSAAVANALDKVKETSDIVTKGDHGRGVIELIDRILASDLKEAETLLNRHNILLGTAKDGEVLRLNAHGQNVIIAGTSGSGKSTLATGILERLNENGYQFCVIDPEGDYESFNDAIVLGASNQVPEIDHVLDVLSKPDRNVIINMLGIHLDHRPAFFESLLPRLLELRAKTGRPHWIVVDEAHHLLQATWDPASLTMPQELQGMIFITVHPEHISKAVLLSVDAIAAIGESPYATIRAFEKAIGKQKRMAEKERFEGADYLLWSRAADKPPIWFRSILPKTARRRHVRKYAEGELSKEKSFYFRGPEGKLNLQAQNLRIFIQMGKGVDDETWLYHLRKGDISKWFRVFIKDEELARDAMAIEANASISANESRTLIEEAINKYYTASA